MLQFFQPPTPTVRKKTEKTKINPNAVKNSVRTAQ